MAAIQDLVLTFCPTMRCVRQRKQEQDDMCLECTAILAVPLSLQQDDKKLKLRQTLCMMQGSCFPGMLRILSGPLEVLSEANL